MSTKGGRKGGRLPWWAWIIIPALAIIALVVLLAVLRPGEDTVGEVDEPGPPAVRPEEVGDVAPGVSMYQISENPQEYYGSTVTVTGEVSEILGSNSFLMVERFGVSGDDLLVVSSVPLSEVGGQSGDAPLAVGHAVEVTGEVREFELVSVEQEIGADLNDEVLDAWDGVTSIIASSISLDPPVPEES